MTRRSNRVQETILGQSVACVHSRHGKLIYLSICALIVLMIISGFLWGQTINIHGRCNWCVWGRANGSCMSKLVLFCDLFFKCPLPTSHMLDHRPTASWESASAPLTACRWFHLKMWLVLERNQHLKNSKWMSSFSLNSNSFNRTQLNWYPFLQFKVWENSELLWVFAYSFLMDLLLINESAMWEEKQLVGI